MKKNEADLVWSSEGGDQRKKSTVAKKNVTTVDPKQQNLGLRRLTSGKGRVVIEISRLPDHPQWCKDLTKKLKSKLGCGGSYKNAVIELHHNELEKIGQKLAEEGLRWVKIGG